MKKIGYLFFTMFAMTLLLASCSEDDPQAPVVELFAEVDENDSYTVNFTTQSEHASSFSWNFGDGESGSGATISHTYTQSGEYTVTLTASGEGGDVSKTKAVTIVASMEELLTGGAAASNGKTWVMSKTASNSDGAFSFTNTPYLPAPDDVLTQFGIGTEYDNEFTFYHDGSYKIDAKNSNVLASAIHAYVNGTLVGDPIWDLGLAVESYTVPQNATFTMNEEELSRYCREYGLYTQDIKAWRKLLEGAFEGSLKSPDILEEELKSEKRKVKELEQDLDKKNKALAETAALLVLRKKADAIWGEPEGE